MLSHTFWQFAVPTPPEGNVTFPVQYLALGDSHNITNLLVTECITMPYLFIFFRSKYLQCYWMWLLYIWQMGTNVSVYNSVPIFMEQVESFCETCVSINHTTWYHTAEDLQINIYRTENLKSLIFLNVCNLIFFLTVRIRFLQAHMARHDYTLQWSWTFWEEDQIKTEIRGYYGCEYEVPTKTSVKFCKTTPHHILDGQQPCSRMQICYTNEEMQTLCIKYEHS
jgi:hypothetical protein